MNSRIPSHDDGEEITSLVAFSAHGLSMRASLVARGLRDIAEVLRADEAKSVLDQALDLYMQSKFAEAVDFCTAQLETDSQDDGLLQIKGVCLALQGDVVEGLDCFDQALAINSENPDCWLLKSRLLKMLDLTDKRVECLRRVIQIEPSYEGAWKDIGACLLELGKYEEAIEAFDSALRQNPSDEDCLSRRNIALARLACDQEPDPSKRGKTSSSPTVIVTLGSWWTEPYDKSPAFSNLKLFNFVCEGENISDREQFLGKQLTVFQRSKRTGDESNSAEVTLLESHLPLRLAPRSTIDPLTVELHWPFPAQQSDEDCLRELFDDTEQVIATDDEFGTMVLLQAAQGDQKRPTEVSFMVVYDSDMGWHVMKEDDIEWELENVDSDGMERRRPLQPCVGPFSSNYDANEGPIGSGKALAEAVAEEKRRLYPKGPVPEGGQGS